MSDVFISYALDDRTRAESVVDALKAKGWSVFWSHGVPSGTSWDDVLHSELRTARCVVVLWSWLAASSQTVHHEASIGKYRGILVPAMLDADLSIDQIPARFRDIQGARLSGLGTPEGVDFEPLVTAVARVLSRRRRLGRRSAWAAGSAAVALLGLVAIRHVDLLRNARRAHLERIEYRNFTTEENERLGRAIRNARSIKLLFPNGNNFVAQFAKDLTTFFSNSSASMQVMLATADSPFYTQMTQMTLGEDWNEQEKIDAFDGNKKRIASSRSELFSMAGNDERKLQFKYFNTQFRLPLILVDDKSCFVTIRLPPDEAAQSLRLEFAGGDAGYVKSCREHFDALWKRGQSQPTRTAF